MSNFIGYKQYREHINTEPEVKTKICSVSNLFTTYNLNSKLYGFDIVTNRQDASTKQKNAYLFTSKDKAEELNKKIKQKFYDQQTEPYLNKIKEGKKLTSHEREQILKIIDTF